MMTNNFFAKTLDLSNSTGRFFGVGDIHGQSEKLNAILDENVFGDQDHLLLVGDLVDRGKDSLSVLRQVLTTANMHTVLGNHEVFLLDFYANHLRDIQNSYDFDAVVTTPANHEYAKFVRSYAHWLAHLTESEWKELHALMPILAEQPVILDVALPKNRRVGVIHAYCPEDFDEARTALDRAESVNHLRYEVDQLTESRSQASIIERVLMGMNDGGLTNKGLLQPEYFKNSPDYQVKGVDLVLHGHSVFHRPVLAGNHLYLDTGGFLSSGHLSLVNIGDILD